MKEQKYTLPQIHVTHAQTSIIVFGENHYFKKLKH